MNIKDTYTHGSQSVIKGLTSLNITNGKLVLQYTKAEPLNNQGAQTVYNLELQNFYTQLANVYLPLTGGTLNKGEDPKPLILETSNTSTSSGVQLTFAKNGTELGGLGFDVANTPLFINTSGTKYELLHTNNLPLKKGSGQSSVQQTGTTASGYYSHAEGKHTLASSPSSHAEGTSTIASGDSSHAEGNITQASGAASSSSGDKTLAHGAASHTEGTSDNTPAAILAKINDNTLLPDIKAGTFRANVAFGNQSHTEGGNTVAYGLQSHAEGWRTLAEGNHSHAEGERTQAEGQNSHAEGYQTKAKGARAHSEGYITKAAGDGSHAEGSGTTASGDFSHAEGSGPTASGDFSHAEGVLTESKGLQSHAEGYKTQATESNAHAEGNATLAAANGAHAEGYQTTAKGAQSHSEGRRATALGNGAHAEGYSTNKASDTITANTSSADVTTAWNSNKFSLAQKDGSHAEGTDTLALGPSSHAEGSVTKASGTGSHAEGNGTTASGVNSHAEGDGTTASNSNSHAEGRGTKASGFHSHAEGFGSKANSDSSHAEGSGTSASGFSSHAEGEATTTSAHYSHAEGRYTIATNQCEHAEGQYNKSNTGTRHSVGIGTSTNDRKNAFEIMSDGKAYLYDIGGYDGTNPQSTNTLQQIIHYNLILDISEVTGAFYGIDHKIIQELIRNKEWHKIQISYSPQELTDTVQYFFPKYVNEIIHGNDTDTEVYLYYTINNTNYELILYGEDGIQTTAFAIQIYSDYGV